MTLHVEDKSMNEDQITVQRPRFLVDNYERRRANLSPLCLVKNLVSVAPTDCVGSPINLSEIRCVS